MPYSDPEKQKSAQKDWYENNKSRYKDSNERLRQRNREYVWAYLLEHPCVDCGESDPMVLEFDHRDSSEKEITINWAILNRWALKRLQAEIDKCEVRCANCHRRRTAQQLGFAKLSFA